MKSEQAKQIVEDAIEQLGQDIEAGHSRTLTQYLSAMARFYRYSFTNTLLIAVQRPDATRVAGFQAWKKLGRQVRKGERGIMILAPMLCTRKGADESFDSAHVEAALKARVLRGFKAAYVFDVSQTDGSPLPEFAAVTGDPGQNLERLKEFVSARGATLVYDFIPNGAEGMSQPGMITLRPDLDEASQFSVLAHEVAHQLLHQSKSGAGKTLTSIETEAESVSYVVCQAVGLDTSTHASDYIQLYSGDRATLRAALASVQECAAEILAALRLDA